MSNARTNGKHAEKPESDGELPVEDPGDWNQRKRLQQMHEVRDYARHTLTNSMHPEAKKMDADEVRNIIFQAVKTYVSEVEPLLLDTEIGDKYLYDTELHGIEIDPPEDAINFYEDNSRRVVNQPESPRPRTIGLSGLSDFLELNPPYVETWSVEYRKRGSHIDTERFESKVTIPRKTSEEAYRTVNLFLREMKLDLNVEEPRPHGKT